ncbi:MAG TPA: hypothetical protein PK186_08800 [candidate division Zixibacteria bacterium]|nr:hypothetical protein [candidate division Zixibacteria bacterium]
MKRTMIVLSAVVVALLPLGCSDDDCAECPAPVTPVGFIQGSIDLHPGVYFEALIFGDGSILPTLDSARVGDSLLVFNKDFFYSYRSEPVNPYWTIYCTEDTGPDYMYTQGDTAHLEFWSEGRLATCDLPLLDPNLTQLFITDPYPGTDTVAPGEPAIVFWNRVEHAQFYAVQVILANRLGDVFTFSDRFDWTADTSFTVSPSLYPPSLAQFSVRVVPFTGPNPAAGSNVLGAWLSGRIVSVGYGAETAIVGWNPSPITKSALPAGETLFPQRTPAEIVEAVYLQAAE